MIRNNIFENVNKQLTNFRGKLIDSLLYQLAIKYKINELEKEIKTTVNNSYKHSLLKIKLDALKYKLKLHDKELNEKIKFLSNF